VEINSFLHTRARVG